MVLGELYDTLLIRSGLASFYRIWDRIWNLLIIKEENKILKIFNALTGVHMVPYVSVSVTLQGLLKDTVPTM